MLPTCPQPGEGPAPDGVIPPGPASPALHSRPRGHSGDGGGPASSGSGQKHCFLGTVASETVAQTRVPCEQRSRRLPAQTPPSETPVPLSVPGADVDHDTFAHTI